MDDRELLCRYAEEHSEEAFAELVRRHANLVYATALRLVGRPAMAEDVAQSVFIQLARKAHSVREGNALPGWLYRATHGAATDALRSERRRRAREAEAVNRMELDANPHASSTLVPLLDEAIRDLNQKQQNAIVLRYLQGKSLRETGQALALTEDAAQKRISRALEKLRVYFLHRGVGVSSAVIVAALSAPAAQAAPAGLAAGLVGTSLAATSTAGTAGLTTIVDTFLMTKAKATIVTAVVVAAAGTALFEAQQASTLRKELRMFQRQHAAQIQQLKVERGTAGSTAALSQKPPMTAAEIEAKIQTIARPGNWRRYREWQDFIQSLASREIPKALAAVEKISEIQVRDTFRFTLLEHWARSDPMAALAYAQSLPGPELPYWTACKVLAVWASDSPSSVRAWVQQLPKGRLRHQALNTIIAASAAENPEATCDLMQSLNAWESTQAEELFAAWARVDPAAAVAKAMDLPFDGVRKTALARIASTWAAFDPKAAMAWAESLPAGSEREDLVGNIIGTWAYSEPKQALAYTFNLPAGPQREETFHRVVRTWATDDPKGAFAWSQSLPDDSAREQMVQGALATLAGQSPQDALAAAQSLSGKNRSDAITSVGRSLAGGDSKAALEYSLQLTEGADRNNYLLGVADGLAEKSPATAAQLVANLPASEARHHIVVKTASTWARLDPTATAAWVETLPEGKLREDALGELAYKWTRKDPAAVLDWLQSLPKDKSWERAFGGYVARISSQTPATAAPLAEAISNPDLRDTMIEFVARDWMKKDRKAAATWLEQTTLPRDRKFRLLNEW